MHLSMYLSHHTLLDNRLNKRINKILPRKTISITNLLYNGGSGDKNKNFIEKQIRLLNKSYNMSTYIEISQKDLNEVLFNKFRTYHNINFNINFKENYVTIVIHDTVDHIPGPKYTDLFVELNKYKIGNIFLNSINGLPKLSKVSFPITIKLPITENLQSSEWDLI